KGHCGRSGDDRKPKNLSGRPDLPGIVVQSAAKAPLPGCTSAIGLDRFGWILFEFFTWSEAQGWRSARKRRARPPRKARLLRRAGDERRSPVPDKKPQG